MLNAEDVCGKGHLLKGCSLWSAMAGEGERDCGHSLTCVEVELDLVMSCGQVTPQSSTPYHSLLALQGSQCPTLRTPRYSVDTSLIGAWSLVPVDKYTYIWLHFHVISFSY